MRVTCDQCGQLRMFSETHSAQGYMLIRDIIARMRPDGCGGRAGKVELLTGIEGASGRFGSVDRAGRGLTIPATSRAGCMLASRPRNRKQPSGVSSQLLG